jgi:hypothetical protein
MLPAIAFAAALLAAGCVLFLRVLRRLLRHGRTWAWSHLVGVVLFFGLCFAGWGGSQMWTEIAPRAGVWRALVAAAGAFGFLLALPSGAMALLVLHLDTKAARKGRNARVTHFAYTAIQAWRRKRRDEDDPEARREGPTNDNSGD